MRRTIRVFFSYARADKEEIERLASALEHDGSIVIYRDVVDILPAEEWRDRLANLIAAADTIVFCLSPASVRSDTCGWEVRHATALNKRVIPVVVRELDGPVPEELSRLNYIFFTEREPFDLSVQKLVRAIETDIAWLREHTRLSELAFRWKATGEPPDQLLRGRELKNAETWRSRRPSSAPEPSSDTLAYLEQSHALDTSEAFRRRIIWSIVGGLAATLAGITVWLYEATLREAIDRYRYFEGRALSSAAESALEPSQQFRECQSGGTMTDVCPTMFVVPPGDFLMGYSGADAKANEQPVHPVSIRYKFAVSWTEITFAQYDLCASVKRCRTLDDNGWGRGDRPAINVNWNDARDYAAWLSDMTGKPYRLLSEAEWEYAARAGTDTPYSFGTDTTNVAAHAWYSSNAGGKTQSVAQKRPNAFGLHDMHGNVWEWVADFSHPDYAGAPQDGRVWPGGTWRILRGGSWDDAVEPYLRSSFRLRYRPDFETNIGIGFRVARSITPE